MDKRKSVLIIAPSMVPRIHSWGGSQRMYYLANTLADAGMEVITMAPKYKTERSCADKEIHYEAIFPGAEIETEARAAGEEHAEAESKSRKVKKLIKKYLKPLGILRYKCKVRSDRFLYNEPSLFEGKKHEKWIQEHAGEVLRCIEERKIEIVIISGPSFSLFKIAKNIKKAFPNVKVVFDYRDPWHLWNGKRNIAYLKEKSYLKNADMVVCFSEPFREDMCKIFQLDKARTEVVYNGYSEEEWRNAELNAEEDTEKFDKLIISYVGSMDFNDNIWNYRNPNRVIEVVKKMPSDRVELVFVGTDRDNKEADSDNIKYIGRVSQAESFAYMMKSDVLLNIHDTQDCSGRYLVSGKFYDYMRSGKMIWNIGNKDSLAGKFVEELELGVNCRNTEGEIEQILKQLLEDKKKLFWGMQKSNLRIRDFSREYQNSLYYKYLQKT